MFEELQKLNKTAFSSYCEVYVPVPMEVLYERDIKNLYKTRLAGGRKKYRWYGYAVYST